MKTRELPDIIRIPLGLIAGILASVMFTSVTFACLKIGEWLLALFSKSP